MLTRVFESKVAVTAGVQDFYREVWTEDGPVERRYQAPVVEARKGGRLYVADSDFASEAGAEVFVSGLPADFDPASHPSFRYLRTVYGSSEWDQEDEVGLMDDAEQERHFQGS